MVSTVPAESFGQLVEQFPGIENLDPLAVGRFAFHAAKHYPEDLVIEGTGEEIPDWQLEIVGALGEISEWRAGYDRRPRAIMAQELGRSVTLNYQVRQIEAKLADVSAEEGLELVLDFLQREGCQIQTEMSRSPLFPEGRSAREPIKDRTNGDSERVHIPHTATIVDAEGRKVPGNFAGYIQDVYPDKRARERVNAALESLEPISKERFEELRQQYGAKAAGLICFNERAMSLNEQLEHCSGTLEIEIPSFVPAGIDMYKAWLEDSAEYEPMLEQIRLQAVGLDDRASHGIVAVRSSARESEDGEEHTGAGVYASVAVDPRDPAAFRKAVETVYASARSEAARTYQAGIGVTDEMMGLLIQAYRESEISGGFRGDMFYGHANSSGPNPKLIDLHTRGDGLLYDKDAVTASLLMRDQSYGAGSRLLHTHPDRDSEIYEAINQLEAIPHAVILAERLFGRPMQVEFAGDAVVQVRPLIINGTENPVTFPEGLAPISECAAVGVDDQELSELDSQGDNSNKVGFVVFWQEYGYTIGRADYDSFPKEGAVIIMNPSSNGHIQAICREKGLLCFYPKEDFQTDDLDMAICEARHSAEDSGAGVLKLRFVSDGYSGRIYQS